MQKVEGSSPFIRFEFKLFRAGDAGNRAPVMPQTNGAAPALVEMELDEGSFLKRGV